MDCKSVREIIPGYVKHTASEEEIKSVEEHLCVCEECRNYLSRFMDKDDSVESAPDKPEEAPAVSAPETTGAVEVPSTEEKTEALSVPVSPPEMHEKSISAILKERDIVTYAIIGVSIIITLWVIILFFKSL